MNPWKIYTLEDAYQDRGPIKYAVSGLFELPSLNIVYGAPSTLKSMLLMDMSACLVKGVPWLRNSDGIATKGTTKLGVLWVDFDNGVRRTHDRVKAVGTHYGLTFLDNFTYVTMPNGGLDMGSEDSVKNLEEAISMETGLVIIDNLGCVIGQTEENSHGMAAVMSCFRALAEKHEVAIVIIHHQRKGNAGTGRVGDSLRGHSSIEASLDLALLVERDEGSNRITVRSTKTRGVDVSPFGAYFRWSGDEDMMNEAWFEGVDTDGIDRQTEREILKFLTSGERNQKQIKEHCKSTLKASATRVTDALNRLLKSGRISERRGSQTTMLYSLKTEEQLEIHYNHEIVPTHGIVNRGGLQVTEEGA